LHRPARELTDLHIHVGAAVAPHILWSIANQQGFKLPVKDYWEFVELVSASSQKVGSLQDYLHILHTVTEKIQSSPAAIERSIYEIIGKEYRGSLVSRIELRFNPMKRNLGGERDLDHIIHAAIRGMDRATMEYGCQAGLIFCLAREFDARLNEIILEKAIKYRKRGVVGIDLAGSEEHALELRPKDAERYASLYKRARDAGLKTTVHTGETPGTGAEGVRAVLELLQPHRIGHGVQAAYDEPAMKMLREQDVTLEICPSSNLSTRAVSGWDELRHVVRTFLDRKVKITINTDGPYLLDTDMKRELELLALHKILDEHEIDQCLAWAREASFLEPEQGAAE
jgi:adenosine deaminase